MNEAGDLQRTKIRQAWVILSVYVSLFCFALADDFTLQAALRCHREISCLLLSLSLSTKQQVPFLDLYSLWRASTTDLRDSGTIFDLLHLRDYRVRSYVSQTNTDIFVSLFPSSLGVR